MRLRGRLFSFLAGLLFPEPLFLHHLVLAGNSLFFASMYRSLSRAFLTFIAEKSVHAFDEVTLLKQQARIYMVLEQYGLQCAYRHLRNFLICHG